MKPVSKTFWVFSFALAMGFLESSVVVYLRELYYPTGFNFPLKAMSPIASNTELFREAATIIMILAVSLLLSKNWLHRFAWFLVIFSVWDLSYYLFLKIILNWPASLFTYDILFLLPCPWTGPVLAPVINSLTMLLLAYSIFTNKADKQHLSNLSNIFWILLISGSVLILIAYMKEFLEFAAVDHKLHPAASASGKADIPELLAGFVPCNFNWYLFCSGAGLHIASVILVFSKKQK